MPKIESINTTKNEVKMNKYSNMSGAKCAVDMTKSNIINEHAYGVINGYIDFQNVATLNVPGIVYVNFVPKGKRKERSVAVHQDRIELI